jgi:large subunit ribosomal protein L25
MELKTLKANAKNDNGKSAARRTRHSGEVPCILYGGGKAPQMLALDLREFEHVLQGRVGQHAIVQLEVESAPEMSSAALLREVQRHPTRDTILHADFQRIRLDERIHTTVPVVLVGQAKGVIEGGVLEHHLREVEVECLALEVPAQIEISVVEMALGHTLHVSHLTAPAGVTILTEADRVVAAVHVPRVIEVKAPEEAEAAEGEAAAAEGDEAKEKKDDKKD